YNHFGSKDALFKQVIESECMRTALDNQFEALASLPPQQALLQVATHFAELVFREDLIHMYRIMIAESVEKPKVSQLFYEAGPEQWTQAFMRLREAFEPRAPLKINNRLSATHHFFNMLKGDAHCRLLLNIEPKPDAKEIESHVRDVVAVFVRA